MKEGNHLGGRFNILPSELEKINVQVLSLFIKCLKYKIFIQIFNVILYFLGIKIINYVLVYFIF